LPKGKPTLLCGGVGCGKTLLAMEFLVRDATEFNEPGVFMAFEETDKELAQSVASMGFDLPIYALARIMFASNAVKPRKPASTIWKRSSSAWKARRLVGPREGAFRTGLEAQDVTAEPHP